MYGVAIRDQRIPTRFIVHLRRPGRVGQEVTTSRKRRVPRLFFVRSSPSWHGIEYQFQLSYEHGPDRPSWLSSTPIRSPDPRDTGFLDIIALAD